jgi:hypothetical protein
LDAAAPDIIFPATAGTFNQEEKADTPPNLGSLHPSDNCLETSASPTFRVSNLRPEIGVTVIQSPVGGDQPPTYWWVALKFNITNLSTGTTTVCDNWRERRSKFITVCKDTSNTTATEGTFDFTSGNFTMKQTWSCGDEDGGVENL